jgi:hypothetical protein
MTNITETKSTDAAESDAVWGARAIGDVIDRTPAQVYYLHRIGALDGAVSKLGPKTFIGSRKKLLALHLHKIR